MFGPCTKTGLSTSSAHTGIPLTLPQKLGLVRPVVLADPTPAFELT